MQQLRQLLFSIPLRAANGEPLLFALELARLGLRLISQVDDNVPTVLVAFAETLVYHVCQVYH